MICVNNATGAMPVLRKLWLMPGGNRAGWARNEPLSWVGAHKAYTARVLGSVRPGRRTRDSGASVQRVVLSQGDRLFDESKIFVEQVFGLRAGHNRRSAIHRGHRKLCAMKVRAILAAYWVEVIDVAPLDDFCD